jgi:predicted DNA-binding protein YlxM (UPF0122 family)
MREDPWLVRLRLQALLDCYGPLLTEEQRQTLHAHEDEDLSITEIAEGRGVSRGAVQDLLARARGRLESYEGRLGWVAERERLTPAWLAVREAAVAGRRPPGEAVELLDQALGSSSV